MATNENYTQVHVSINGALSLEATSIKLTHASNIQPQKSILKGFCGTTQGAPMCNFSLEFIVPSNAFEKNWTEILATGQTVSFEFRAAGLTCALDKASIESQDISYGVDGSTSLSISGFASFSKFQ